MRLRVLLTATLATALYAATAGAGGPGKWDVISTGGTSRPNGEIGHVRTSDGRLHVLWTRRTGGNSYDLMHTPISRAGVAGAPLSVVTGWHGLSGVALTMVGQDVLWAWFPGIKTVNPGEPDFGLIFSTGDGRSWDGRTTALTADQFAHGRTPSAANVQFPNGIASLVAWDGRDGVGVFVGGGVRAFRLGYGPNGSTARCCNHGVNIATHQPSRRTFVAWCTMNEGENGIWAQEVSSSSPDASSFGTPVGSPQRMPASTNGQNRRICDAGQRLPLAVRPDGTFWIAAKDGSDTSVRLWRIGASSSMVIAQGSQFRRVGLAAASDGRLWVGWSRFTSAARLHFRRSNRAATRFGETVSRAGPRGSVDALVIDLSAQNDRADVLATYSAIPGTDLWHSQVLPGLTLSATGGRVLRFLVTDAGGPVAGASISVGGKRLRTDRRGRAAVDLRRGRFTASAAKPGYVADTVRVRSR